MHLLIHVIDFLLPIEPIFIYCDIIETMKRTSLDHKYCYIKWLAKLQKAYLWKLVIQNKVCTEYRDMLPRPMRVCQKPGIRQIGRSPGIPDKSSRVLGSMSRYSAFLICFMAYIFHFFIPQWVWLGPPPCTLPSAIAHCNQNEAGHQTIKSPSMLSLRCSWMKSLSGIYATGLMKLTDKMDEICINGKFSIQEPNEWRDFCIPMSEFTVFQPII